MNFIQLRSNGLCIENISAFSNSPIDTTSAPDPIFLNSLNKVRFELDFTEKHIIGLIFLNTLLNLKKLFLNCASE